VGARVLELAADHDRGHEHTVDVRAPLAVRRFWRGRLEETPPPERPQNMRIGRTLYNVAELLLAISAKETVPGANVIMVAVDASDEVT